MVVGGTGISESLQGVRITIVTLGDALRYILGLGTKGGCEQGRQRGLTSRYVDNEALMA
jgi:hypothetical protein